MSVHVEILTGPLGPLPVAAVSAAPVEVGARLVFEGLVREVENGKQLIALDYEAYEPMAQREIEAIARDLVGRHGLHAMVIRHSRGRVPVGACSFQLVVTSPHRAAALTAMAEFIDRLKQDVPIWKRVVWTGGVGGVVGATPGPA